MQNFKKYIFAILASFTLVIGSFGSVYASDTPINADGTTMSAEEAATYVAPQTQAAAPVEQPVVIQEPATVATEPATVQETTVKETEPETTTKEETTTEKETTKPDKVTPIIKGIDALPAISDISLKNEGEVKKLRDAYNALSEKEQSNVSNINTLSKIEEILKKEKDKKYSYSFEIEKPVEDNNEPHYLYIAAEEEPSMTFVSPSGNEFIFFDMIVSNTINVSKINSDEEEDILKITLSIESSESGIWTIKTDIPATVSTKSFDEITEETTEETSEEETTSEEVKEPETSESKFLALYNRLPKKKIALYGGFIILIIVGVFLAARYLGKKVNPDPQDALENPRKGFSLNKSFKEKQPVFNDENMRDINDDIEEFDTTPIETGSGNLQKKKVKDLFNKKQTNNKAVNDLDDIEIEEDNDITYIDDEIERLKNQTEEMYQAAQLNEKNERQAKETSEEDIIIDDEIEYITQEDIDNDITIEEYVDGDVVNNKEKEIEEQIRKKRSFFPEDRFS